jgi:hypothetical protein
MTFVLSGRRRRRSLYNRRVMDMARTGSALSVKEIYGRPCIL